MALTIPNEAAPVVAITPVGTRRDALSRQLPPFEPGAMLAARVQGVLADGNLQVDVDGVALRMELPGSVRTGDKLGLTYITNQPRLAFALNSVESIGQPTPALSALGRQIAALVAQTDVLNLSTLVSVQAPLLAAGQADATPLLAALRQSIDQSGLFYEAHQAQWVAGTRGLDQLRLEPQATTGQQVQTNANAAARPVEAPPPALAALVAGSAGTVAGPPAAAGEALIHPGSLPLVQQQLGTLESGRAALLLEVWPGQWAQWEIEEEPAKERAEAQAQTEWRTRLRLDLPRLGAIDVSIALRADGLHVLVEATDDLSAELLLEHRASLQQALEDAGLTAAGVTVSSPEKPLPPSSAASPSSASPSSPSPSPSSPSPSHRRRPVPSPATPGLRPAPQ